MPKRNTSAHFPPWLICQAHLPRPSGRSFVRFVARLSVGSLADSPALVSKMARSASASVDHRSPPPGKHRHPCIIPSCRPLAARPCASLHVKRCLFVQGLARPSVCTCAGARANPPDQPGYRSRTRRIMRPAPRLKRVAGLSPE